MEKHRSNEMSVLPNPNFKMSHGALMSSKRKTSSGGSTVKSDLLSLTSLLSVMEPKTVDRYKPQSDTKSLEQLKMKRSKLIKNLLNDVDIEATKAKYLNDSAVEMRFDHLGVRFQRELSRLMGSDIVRFNDKDWDEKFNKAIKRQYEEFLSEKEGNLAEAERERLRRLKDQGIDPQVGKSVKKRRKRLHSNMSFVPVKSQRSMSLPEEIKRDTLIMLAERRRSKSDGLWHSEKMHSEMREAARFFPRFGRHDVKLTKSATSRSSRKSIYDLYEEESVKGLYEVAKEIVEAPDYPKHLLDDERAGTQAVGSNLMRRLSSSLMKASSRTSSKSSSKTSAKISS